MKKRSKTILTTVLLGMALFQGPYFYYLTAGIIKVLLSVPFALVALILTIILLLQLVIYRSTNTLYHKLGLAIAFIIGISTFFPGTAMEYLDFHLRMNERLKIIDEVKSNSLKSRYLPDEVFLISNPDNGIYYSNQHGLVHVEFYIDPGFIDHSSVFLYTNDPVEISHLDDEIRNKEKDTAVNKLADNWYGVGY